jgi:serine/threonine protein kinase
VFDEVRLRDALLQLVEGLRALHEAQKVHRDVKPSNVLVSREGQLKLVDFGLATDLTGREHRSEVDIVGTVEYMAPEQAAGRQVGAPADWYSMGVLLFEALTGDVPISGSPIEVLMSTNCPATAGRTAACQRALPEDAPTRPKMVCATASTSARMSAKCPSSGIMCHSRPVAADCP